MRMVMTLWFLTALAVAQSAPAAQPSAQPAPAASTVATTELTIPAGTKVPLALKHAISTKSAKEGDAV